MITSFCLFIAVSCTSENWSDVLDRVPSDELVKNSRTGWELEQRRPSKNSWDYFLKKIDGDTTKSLIMTNRNKHGRPGALRYLAYFPCERVSSDTCVVEIEPPADTLYFYRVRNGDKEFVVGEYAFKRMNLELSREEFQYYMLHEDSLDAIRGDNLPPLPALNPAEQAFVDSLLQGSEKLEVKDED